eukprot:Gb_36145 [translate_table: standard]
MGRSPCCVKVGLKKGPWTPEEDQKLIAYIEEHGHGSWKSLPQKAGLLRCGKSCRLRWANYLRPGIKRGKFSLKEEQTIIQLHALLGNRWSAIATHLPKRTDNEIKNYWNTHLKKRLLKMGIDPVTHKPTSDSPIQIEGQFIQLSHKAQWETARLEAEARLTRVSSYMKLPELNKIIWTDQGFINDQAGSQAYGSTSCLNLMKFVQNKWNNNNNNNNNSSNNSINLDKWKSIASSTTSMVISSPTNSTLSSLQTQVSNVNPTKDDPTGCVRLLHKAMRPSNKGFCEEVVRFVAERKNQHGENSLQCSDVTQEVKGSSHNIELKAAEHNSLDLLPIASTEGTSNGGGSNSCSNYNGFTTDMLLDLVDNAISLTSPGAEPSTEDQYLCLEENKEYWNNILNFFDSSP